ncbi:MAG: PfkB family carbohydrate kinase [Spirochaetaceae bacterium]|nr:PfkB family carbohydrate kinase [Spirochaetaceae bacterium]
MADGARVDVVGSINTDLVAYVERLPAPGETLFGERFAQFAGGKGANQAVAAARAGAAASFHGAVGDDAFGHAGRAGLRQAGVAVDGLLTLPEHASGIALILVDGRGENEIVVVSGANVQFTAGQVAAPPAAPAPPAAAAPVLLLQNEVAPATTQACARRWHAAGARVIWNMAPAPATAPPEDLLAACEFILVNEVELAALTGAAAATDVEQTSARAAGFLTGSGAALRNLVVTLGAAGCLWAHRDGSGAPALHRQPALPVTAVDTVGAGDCFCGVFAATLAAGATTAAALHRATAAAALAVQRPGAQPSMPPAGEIEESMRTLPLGGAVAAP